MSYRNDSTIEPLIIGNHGVNKNLQVYRIIYVYKSSKIINKASRHLQYKNFTMIMLHKVCNQLSTP